MKVIHASEGETSERTGEAIFEGRVWSRPLASKPLSADYNCSIVQFAAGARTRMHHHSGDQMLYVVSGIGKVGTGAEERTIAAGDFVLIPADEDHWHGAADTGSPMSHISITRADGTTTVTG